MTVADPGFSPGGMPTPKVGVLTYFFGRKLHENERIWTPRGGARPWRPPLDPPLYDCKAQPIMARVANAREGRLPALRTVSLMIDSPEQIWFDGQGDADRLRKRNVDVYTGSIAEHMFLARMGILQ